MLNEKPKLQQLTIKPFKIGGWEIRSCEYGAYCAWMKEEKEMKETNLEHYKKELKKMFNENYKEHGNIIFEIRKKIDESIKSDRYYSPSTYTDDILDWMAQPYEEKILNEEERRFVGEAIKPFREIVGSIRKKLIDDEGDGYFLWLDIINEKYDVYHAIVLPTEIMCKGMELGKDYTLEELGL